jgi:hypothetical protein
MGLFWLQKGLKYFLTQRVLDKFAPQGKFLVCFLKLGPVRIKSRGFSIEI